MVAARACLSASADAAADSCTCLNAAVQEITGGLNNGRRHLTGQEHLFANVRNVFAKVRNAFQVYHLHAAFVTLSLRRDFVPTINCRLI